jgi:hypothetical protein
MGKTEGCRELKDATKVAGFIGKETVEVPLSDAMEFEEFLDSYMDDKEKEVNPSTLTHHLRYFRWFLLWKYSNRLCDITLFPVIDEHIANYQNFASRRDHHVNLLNFLSPHKLVTIREKVVTALREYQATNLDPYIIDFLRKQELTQSPSDAFTKNLRNWLELCLRFIDVPMRIQCSMY